MNLKLCERVLLALFPLTSGDQTHITEPFRTMRANPSSSFINALEVYSQAVLTDPPELDIRSVVYGVMMGMALSETSRRDPSDRFLTSLAEHFESNLQDKPTEKTEKRILH